MGVLIIDCYEYKAGCTLLALALVAPFASSVQQSNPLLSLEPYQSI